MVISLGNNILFKSILACCKIKGLAYLEVDLANCSLAGEPFDKVSEALILSIDLDVKDLMDLGDCLPSINESNDISVSKFFL